jgi:hypothetical protein
MGRRGPRFAGGWACYQVGRMIRLRRRAAFPYATLLLLYPAVYYVTFTQPRYGYPIEPVLLVLAVYVVSEARELRAADAHMADS